MVKYGTMVRCGEVRHSMVRYGKAKRVGSSDCITNRRTVRSCTVFYGISDLWYGTVCCGYVGT